MTDQPKLVQVGWRSKDTGEVCDCPLGERSPHANSEPVYVLASGHIDGHTSTNAERAR